LGLQHKSDAGVGLLTPGWHNDSYYEHAYMARYLGFMLLEGEDITVYNGQTMVRTVDGLKPLDVIWRRFDAAFIDPLELNSNSMIGTAGLAEQVRTGQLDMINCPGSGIMESRFMLAFLPRICEVLRGEPLKLPNIATWWCGQDSQRDFVRTHPNMLIGSAHSTLLPFDLEDMEPLSQQALGADHVGQEPIKISTTPVMVGDHLVPRPMSMRVFMARTATGWEIMPGGYARIAKGEGQSLLALQKGGQVADVWIKSQKKVNQESLAPDTSADYVRRLPEVLPSRVADNTFWLGRYIERAEALTRMVRAYHRRASESDQEDSPLLTLFTEYLAWYDIQPDDIIPETLCYALDAAVNSAGHLRDRYSTDGWTALKELRDTAHHYCQDLTTREEALDAAQTLLRKISSLSGLIQESMYQHTGWRFLKIGRALERGSMLTHTVRHFTMKGAPNGALDIPVDIADSAMTHRRRYVVNTNRETVIDLLALDPLNPRSILYQVNECKDHSAHLPKQQTTGPLDQLSKTTLKLQTDLMVMTANDVTTPFLAEVEQKLYRLNDHLSDLYFR